MAVIHSVVIEYEKILHELKVTRGYNLNNVFTRQGIDLVVLNYLLIYEEKTEPNGNPYYSTLLFKPGEIGVMYEYIDGTEVDRLFEHIKEYVEYCKNLL